MSEKRRKVIQALFDVMTDMSAHEWPTKMTPAMQRLHQLTEEGGEVTPEEHREAMDLVTSSMGATLEFRDRQEDAWELLTGRPWPRPSDPPPDWAKLFDDLPPDRLRKLEELYDALPDGAQKEYDRRYGRPEL